jgi:cardiolipin synthase
MASSESYSSPYPWREGNRFKLLIDGDQFYPAMLQAIATSHSQIFLEMYLVESGQIADRFIDALLGAVARGATVYLLLDDFGARGLNRSDRERMLQGNITLIFYNRLRYGELRRNFFRDHRKLLVVDNHIAFVGGAGIADDFASPDKPQRRWRETVVAIEGPVVADWQKLFRDTWRHVSGESLQLPSTAQSGVVGKQRGRINYTRGFFYPEIKRTVINQIRAAHTRVWLATAYFVPAMKLRRALRQAARRGVDVRILTPGDHTDHPAVRHAGRRFYHRLLHDGVRIFEYQPRFTHSKILLCDEWVTIGSSNIDRWTLRWNLEANQEIDDAVFAAEVTAMLERDFQNSEECLFGEWRNRPWYQRAKETFWGWVDIWLERLFHRPPRNIRKKSD